MPAAFLLLQIENSDLPGSTPSRNKIARMGGVMKKSLVLGLAAVAVVAWASRARAQDDEETAAIHFLVLKEDNGKPVRNAAVVMHPVNRKGKQESGGTELKTDADGKCYYDGVPYGTLRIQVLAHGFQTFGQDYEIDQPKLKVTVRLKRPQGQFSIYKDDQNDQKQAPPEKK